MLNLQITCRNFEMTERTSSYLNKKLRKYEKLIPSNTQINVEIACSELIKPSQIIELKIKFAIPHNFVYFKTEGTDILTLIDNIDSLVLRKLKTIKQKKYQKKRKASSKIELSNLTAAV